jgi:hypothetical protein
MLILSIFAALALGTQARDIMVLVARAGAGVAFPRVIVGCIVAVALAPLMRGLLFAMRRTRHVHPCRRRSRARYVSFIGHLDSSAASFPNRPSSALRKSSLLRWINASAGARL